jgi:hypothetical protein
MVNLNGKRSNVVASSMKLEALLSTPAGPLQGRPGCCFWLPATKASGISPGFSRARLDRGRSKKMSPDGTGL